MIFLNLTLVHQQLTNLLFKKFRDREIKVRQSAIKAK